MPGRYYTVSHSNRFCFIAFFAVEISQAIRIGLNMTKIRCAFKTLFCAPIASDFRKGVFHFYQIKKDGKITIGLIGLSALWQIPSKGVRNLIVILIFTSSSFSLSVVFALTEQ